MSGFVVRPEDVHGQSLVLRDAEACHLVRARRHRVGQEIGVIDGNGHFYQVCIAAIKRNEVSCKILVSREECGESSVQLSLAPALIKGQRFDYVVEKATEIGVARIAPLLTERGVVGPGSGKKLERWQRVARAAVKQCGRSRLPVIDPPGRLEEIMREFREQNDLVLMATPGDPDQGLRQCLAGGSAVRLGLLVGPEGGFSPAEQAQARACGVELFAWGKRTLRADTASIVLAALVLHEAEQAHAKE